MFLEEVEEDYEDEEALINKKWEKDDDAWFFSSSFPKFISFSLSLFLYL